MNTSSSADTRLCGCKAHGGSEARQIAIEFRRQAFIRRMLNPEDALRHRVIAFDSPSAALLGKRDRRGSDDVAQAAS